MSKCYYNGGCLTCMFAERDERNRFIAPCSGYSNCAYQEFEGIVDISEEEKDEKIKDLEVKLAKSEEQLNNTEQMCLICNKDQENEQLKQQLAEKEKLLKKYVATSCPINQDKIELLIRIEKSMELCERDGLFFLDKFKDHIKTIKKELEGK